MDFLIPEHRVENFIDEYWQIDIEPAVEAMMNVLGVPGAIAIFDTTITSTLTADLRRGLTETYVYALESDFEKT